MGSQRISKGSPFFACEDFIMMYGIIMVWLEKCIAIYKVEIRLKLRNTNKDMVRSYPGGVLYVLATLFAKLEAVALFLIVLNQKQKSSSD